jgi:pyocin large subunit-like protein
MSSLRRIFVFGFLFFIFAGILAYAQVEARNFAPGQLEAHYLKHGYQFGQMTQEQYLQAAQNLLDAEPGGDILEKIRPDGDVEHYRVSTGEFAVMTKRGRIRTYFKTHYDYWLRQ